MLTYLQAIVIALIQGVTELFPVSSLGHSVLVPAWIGGSWQTLVTQSSEAHSESSFYLAFLVALHVATALALLWFFRADWIRIVTGFFRSVGRSISERRFTATGQDERLAWLIVIATIPVGITGVALEHVFRTALAKPVAASAFLFINGLILLAGDRFARMHRATARAARRQRVADGAPSSTAEEHALPAEEFSASGARSASDLAAAYASDARISGLPYTDGLRIGILQIFALFAGISRSGITMVGGLWRGLGYEGGARDPRRGRPQAAEPLRQGGRSHPRAGDRRDARLRRCRVLLRALPGQVLRDPHPVAVRDLLPRGRRRQLHPLRGLLSPPLGFARLVRARGPPAGDRAGAHRIPADLLVGAPDPGALGAAVPLPGAPPVL